MNTRVLTSSSWTGNTGIARVNAVLEIQRVGQGDPIRVNLPTLQVNYSCYQHEVVDLANGFNSITIPVSATNVKATGVFILLPEGNTTAVTVKGVTGDTGQVINPGGWVYICFPTTSPPTALGITAGAAIAGVELIWH